jgi:DNA anti-recombination protein RmuC
LNAGVRELQDGNEKKLEEMRKTVDEKIHTTLEKRLGESFKLVSDQLESVQKGLGERQSLAMGAGDLKRVLSNVKARGTWAEVQLGALLDEILAPGQFEKNVHVEAGAADLGEREATQRATEALARAIRLEAQDIHRKYVKPPHTTDFARFGDVRAKVKRQLDTASRTIDQTGVRTRAMERKLRAVEQLPGDEAERVLDLAAPVDEPEPEEPLAVLEEDDQTTIQRPRGRRAPKGCRTPHTGKNVRRSPRSS